MRGTSDKLNNSQGNTVNNEKQVAELAQWQAQEKKWAAREERWQEQEEKWEAREVKWAERAEKFADDPDKLSVLETKWDAIREKWDDARERWDEMRKEWLSNENDGGQDSTSNTYSISVGTTAAELNALIANADVGATFILQEGTHEFTETIHINRDDIIFKGESEDGTILNFTFPDGVGGNAIEVSSGAGKTEFSELVASASAGSTEITIADTSALNVGDVIYISQANTQEYLLENGWDNVAFEDAENRPFREMIARIEAINGNTLSLSSPLPYDFDAAETGVFHIDLLDDVTLENFTITSGINTELNYNDFVNSHSEFNQTSVILIEGADGANLSNISILDAPSNAFDFRSTIELIGNNLHVDGAHNLGGGGNGYGFQLYETFDATLSDLEIYNVRHSVLFSSWHAEAGNHVEITSTNRDVNFHGSPDIGNTVIVHQSILEYNPDQHTGSGNGFWDIVSGGGSRHANPDFYDTNTILFTYAEGSEGTETIYAADGGAYLDGNGSQDILIGGNGDDIIIGGTSRDTLIGGDGSDIFVFEVGDSFDTITDFSGSTDGDMIWFAGQHNLLTFDDLSISQNGDDANITYGSSSRIILADYDIALLEAGFFVFQGDPTSGFFA